LNWRKSKKDKKRDSITRIATLSAYIINTKHVFLIESLISMKVIFFTILVAGLSSPAGYLPAAYYAAAAGPTMSAAGLGAHYAAAAVPTSVSGQTAQTADSRLQ